MNGVKYTLTLEDMISGPFQAIAANAEKVNSAVNKASAGIDKLAAGPVALSNSMRRTGKTVNDFREQLRRLSASRDATGSFDTKRIEKYNHLIDITQKKIDSLTKKKDLPNVNPPADSTGGGLPGWIKGAGATIAGVFAVNKVMQFGSSVVDTGAKFQKLEAVLTNTLGSSSEAQKSFKMINDLAGSTPFQVDELTDSFVKLANQGFKPTRDELTSLGDLAASKGKSFDQLTEAVIDAQVGEFERMKEFGVRAQKSGDQIIFTFKGQKTAVKNTEDAIKDYILSLGKMNGVQGSMASISTTTGGKISNLEDKFTNLKNEIFQGTNGAINSVIDGLGGVIDVTSSVIAWMGEHESLVKSVGVAILAGAAAYTVYSGIATVVAARSAILTAFTAAQAASTGGLTLAQWALNAAMYANPIGVVIAGVAALAGGIYWLWNNIEEFRAANVALWNGLVTLFTNVWNKTKAIAIGIGGVIKGIATGNITMIMDSIKETGDAFMQDVTAGVVESAAKGYADGVKSFRDDKAAENKNEESTNFLGGKQPNGSGNAGGGTNLKAGIAGVTSDSKASRNVTIQIENLVKNLNISATTLKESASRIREEVSKVLIDVVNDANLAGA